MAQPASSAVYVSVPLTNLAVAFVQDTTDYIADKVFPTVPTVRQGGEYWKMNQDDWYRIEARERAPGTESAGAGWNQTLDTFYSRVFAFHKDVDDQTASNYQEPWPLESAATTFVMNQLLMKREFDWAANYFTAGVWGLDLTGVGATPSTNQYLQWDNANATPIDDIRLQMRKMKEKTGYKPNTLVLGPYVADKILNHPTVLARFQYTRPVGNPDATYLTEIFGIPRVFIAEGVVNSASEGANGAYSYMFGKSALLAYAAPAPSINLPSAGYTFTWSNYIGNNDAGVAISQFRMQQLRSDRVEGEIVYSQKVVAASLGTFFAAAVS